MFNQTEATAVLAMTFERYLVVAFPLRASRLITTKKAVMAIVGLVVDNLMYTNHAINFILYMLSGNKFRKEFKRLLCSRGQNAQTNNNRAVHLSMNKL
ncbi:uncharacterized protein LOC126807686 [Patella vulgata]|uniref:uncharacterized protein LOC126807686 n=1 Tax=Patella vulgata TaxID=6465 RepID=UPI002180806B|nr:uncharacterized protein LOC126807686 [Patella vulgata]